MQIRQELALLEEVEKHKAAVDEELQRQSTGPTWGKQTLQLMQLPGVGFVVAMTVLSAIGDISRFESAKQLVGYAGIGAGVHDSGKTHREKKITKKGRRELRWATPALAVRCKCGGSSLAGGTDVAFLESRIRKTFAAHAQTQSGNCGDRAETPDRHLACPEQRRNRHPCD
jgi:transposase